MSPLTKGGHYNCFATAICLAACGMRFGRSVRITSLPRRWWLINWGANAYPTMFAPRMQRFPVPVILNCPDNYCKAVLWHFAVDCDAVREDKIQMLLCHQSQIREWLPFVDSLNDPAGALYRRGPNGENLAWSMVKWREQLLQRGVRLNAPHGFLNEVFREYFAVTSWGYGPETQKICEDFPFFKPNATVD